MLWGPLHPATANACGHSLTDTCYVVLWIQTAGRVLHSAILLPVPIRKCQALTFLQILHFPDKLGTWLFQRMELIDAIEVIVIFDFALHQEEHMSGGACASRRYQTQAAPHALDLQQ